MWKSRKSTCENMSSVKVFTFLIFLNCVNGNEYCAFEHDGEAKYYVCHLRNEYCCRLGCCVNLAFQFYQMWYYWLLLIFMFMLCSGGGWWYRFCRQPPSVTSYTTANPASHHVSERQFHRRATLQQSHRRQRLVLAMQHSRVLMNDPSMNVVWKSATNSQPPPNYYSSSNSFYHANSPQTALNYRASVQQLQCPYYQLYGPPPSYDSVVQIANSCGSEQPTCVLVTTDAVSCSFVTPSLATATLPLNEIPSSSDQLSNIEDPVTVISPSPIHQPNDFEQPSTSSDILNDSRRFTDTRRKSGVSSVSF